MLFKPTVLALAALSASAVSASVSHIRRSPIAIAAPAPAPLRVPPPVQQVAPRQDDVAAAAAPPAGKCAKGKKLKRKAWHTLTKKDKKAYIDAELCLMSKPATLGLPSAANRFEELQSIHQIPASITHNVGAFLPYHRLHMHAHEKAMREECGYRGAQPYVSLSLSRQSLNNVNSDSCKILGRAPRRR